jgi:hypothetical protein
MTNVSGYQVGILSLLAVIVIVVTLGVSAYLGWIPLSTPTSVSNPNPTGNISLTIAWTDALTGGACTCTGQNANAAQVYSAAGAFPVAAVTSLNQLVTGAGSTAKTVGIAASYAGQILASGDQGTTTDFIDPAKTVSLSNGLITNFQLIDLFATGNLNVLFQINLKGLGINTQSAIAVTVTFRTLSNDDANYLFNTPTTQTSIGTGTKTISATWQLQTSGGNNLNNNKAYSLGRIRILSNETTMAQFATLTQLNVGFAGAVYSISKNCNTITSDTGGKLWNCDLGVVNFRQEFYQILLGRKQGDPGFITVTATFQTYFVAAGTGVTETVQLDAAQPNNVMITQLTGAFQFRS